jgi:hypothetical protein
MEIIYSIKKTVSHLRPLNSGKQFGIYLVGVLPVAWQFYSKVNPTFASKYVYSNVSRTLLSRKDWKQSKYSLMQK